MQTQFLVQPIVPNRKDEVVLKTLNSGDLQAFAR
jgi:hypothetical protein